MGAASAEPNMEFERVHTGEPHAERRRALLARYPAIRSLYGYDRRAAWVTFAVVVAQIAIGAFVGWQSRVDGIGASWWIVLPVAYLVGAPLTHWASMAIHESSHGLTARTHRGNQAVALLANLPLVLPVAMTFHRYHGAHHNCLGIIGIDSDLPIAIERRYIGNSTVRKLLSVVLHPLVYFIRGLTFAKKPNRGELFNVALMIAVNLAIYRYLGPMALVYFGICFFFAHGLHPVAGHFIHEHYSFAEKQETFSYYGPLNWITFNVGYHNEHHDFPKIPGSRLPELVRMVPEYRSLISHSSWTAILWRFITDPSMGYASRRARTLADFQRGKREGAI